MGPRLRGDDVCGEVCASLLAVIVAFSVILSRVREANEGWGSSAKLVVDAILSLRRFLCWIPERPRDARPFEDDGRGSGECN